MHTLVIGGGLAGLAASVLLARHGVSVTLVEARPRLGGRAASFRDSTTGQWIDLCQHVAMGCCTQLLQFFRSLGLQRYLAKQERLVFLTRDGRRSYFRADPWPAPLHLSRALLAAHYLTPAEKFRVLRGLNALLRCDPQDDPPLEPWLRTHGQTDRTIRRFWNTVLVSALNDSVTALGRKYARKVFVDGFLRQRDGWVVYLPVVPLDRLYGDELRLFFARHNVAVRCQTRVRRLLMDPHAPRVVGAELRDGTVLQADHYVVAVPFQCLTDLLPPSVFDQFPCFAAVRQLQPSSITSVHLWYDRPILPWPHAVVVDGVCQWLFRRVSNSHDEDAPSPGSCVKTSGGSGAWADGGGERYPIRWPTAETKTHYLQVVISASTPWRSIGHAGLQQEVIQELKQLLPAARTARLLHSRVVTEHAATFRPLPGVDRYRPGQATPLYNLTLAGDWTDTGWPATMESAVRSGYLAAQVVLNRMGRPVCLNLS